MLKKSVYIIRSNAKRLKILLVHSDLIDERIDFIRRSAVYYETEGIGYISNHT